MSKTLQLSRRPWVWIAVTVLILVLIIVFWRMRQNPAHPVKNGQSKVGAREAPPMTVGVRTVKREDFPIFLNALGTVTPKATAAVRARVDGLLLTIHFQEGQWVREGQVLAQIDPRPFQAQVNQNLGQLQKDQALLTNAKLDLDRYKKLQALDSISQQQVDTQQALVNQYQGVVEADQGLLDNARLQLGYTKITAPINGRIGLRQVDVGNLVRSTDASGVASIVQTRPITVLFSLPANQIDAVREHMKNQPLKVEVFDSDMIQSLAQGTLKTLDNQIDIASSTVKLRAEFANTNEALFPNQFVNVLLLLEVRKNALKVPTSAVQTGQNNSAYVYLLNPDNKVHVRKVKTGPTHREWTLLEDGLAENDQVIVDGTDKLRDGMQVTPRIEGAVSGVTSDTALENPARSAKGRKRSAAPM